MTSLSISNIPNLHLHPSTIALFLLIVCHLHNLWFLFYLLLLLNPPCPWHLMNPLLWMWIWIHPLLPRWSLFRQLLIIPKKVSYPPTQLHPTPQQQPVVAPCSPPSSLQPLSISNPLISAILPVDLFNKWIQTHLSSWPLHLLIPPLVLLHIPIHAAKLLFLGHLLFQG